MARMGMSTNPTVTEFGERYYTEQVVPNWKDPSGIRRYLNKEIYPAFGEKPLKDVNALDVQALVYRKRSRVLTPAEIRLYLCTIYRSNIRRQFKLALHIILLTLSRKSELLLARWEHVNLETGEWLIPEDNAKTGKPHIVYLPTQAVEIFQELKRLAGGSELVLPGRSSFAKHFAKMR
jgi:integrase